MFKGVVVQDVRDRIAHFTHGILNRAETFCRVGTVRTFLVSGLADTPDRGQRSIQESNDLSHRQVAGWLDQRIAAVDAPLAGDEPGALQREENLLEKLDGNLLSLADFMSLEQALVIMHREFQQRAEPVLAFFGEFHVCNAIKLTELVKLLDNIKALLQSQVRNVCRA